MQDVNHLPFYFLGAYKLIAVQFPWKLLEVDQTLTSFTPLFFLYI